MTHPYTNAPMPQPPGRPAPRWARKRYALPALGLAFFVGLAAGGTSGQDSTGTDAKPAAASPRPTATVTATTTEPAPTPTAAPTVTVTATATKTVKVKVTTTAPADPAPAADDSSGGGGSVYYANCSEVRAAGAAPIRRGQPGYASHLDRDNDGVACDT